MWAGGRLCNARTKYLGTYATRGLASDPHKQQGWARWGAAQLVGLLEGGGTVELTDASTALLP